MRHNPEKRAWRGRSYRKGGIIVPNLKEAAMFENQADQELEDERGAVYGDPRRCPVHPNVSTSSADGMFDAPCSACEAAMDEDEAEGEGYKDDVDETSYDPYLGCDSMEESFGLIGGDSDLWDER
jgi:hypothetical protein